MTTRLKPYDVAEKIQGMSLEGAQTMVWDQGYISRVSVRNGRNKVFSVDANPRRINLVVVDDVVVEATVG